MCWDFAFDTADALMAVSTAATVVGTGLSAYGKSKEANANRQAAEFNAAAYEENAKFAEYQADDAIRRGQIDVHRARLSTRQLIGQQRAAIGANNIRLDDGSALDIQMDAAMLGEMDAAVIRENANREAQGYRQQGVNYQGQAQVTRTGADNISPFLSAVPTVVAGAGAVSDRWLRYNTGS